MHKLNKNINILVNTGIITTIESHKIISSCIGVRTYSILVVIKLSDSLLFSWTCQKLHKCELVKFQICDLPDEIYKTLAALTSQNLSAYSLRRRYMKVNVISERF